MGVERMQGTAWHLEQVHRSDGDARRYKGRCWHYVDASNDCTKRNGKCIGSAHCAEYRAMTEEQFKKKQKKNSSKKSSKKSKATGEDDCFWY